MGNLVGVLSTVILVSTLMTLAFAVFAYIGSRKRQTHMSTQRHSGHYSVPNQSASPELPREFVLRMHDVHTFSESRTAENITPSMPASPPESPESEQPHTPDTPLFRSLAEKKARSTTVAPPADGGSAPADKETQ